MNIKNIKVHPRLKFSQHLVLKIDPVIIYMVLCLLPFFESRSFQFIFHIPRLYNLYYWARTFVGALSIGIYLYKYRKLSEMVFLSMIWAVIYVFCCLMTSIKLDWTVYFIFSVAGLICFFEICTLKYDYKVYLSCYLLLFVFLTINFLGVVFRPEGLTSLLQSTEYDSTRTYRILIYERMNFLGNDNNLPPFFMPFWFCAAYLFKRNLLSKKMFIFSDILIGLNVIAVWSVTSILGFISLVVFSFFLIKNIYFSFSRKNIVFFIFLMNVIVVLGSSLLTPLAEAVFHKGLTFSSRSRIWQEALRMFFQNPLLGTGNKQSIYVVNIAGRLVAPHNFWLSILLQGGILFFLATVCLFNAAIPNVRSCNVSKVNSVIYASILSYFLIGTAETQFMDYGIWICFAMYNAARYSRCIMAPKRHAEKSCCRDIHK